MLDDKIEEVYTPRRASDVSVSSSPPWICVICGDWGSGNHYGALTCFGCKGFFLRAVRSKHKLICLEEEKCEITKDKRKQCRYCRMQRCLQAGMKTEAVRKESRTESQPKKKMKDCASNTDDLMEICLKEEKSTEMCLSLNYIPRPRDNAVVTFLINADSYATKVANCAEPTYCTTIPIVPDAGPKDLDESFILGLHEIVEWAKYIPMFNELNLNDKLCILRTHVLDLAILEWIRRSLPMQDMMILANGTKSTVDNVPYSQTAIFISQFLKELVEPCRSLNLDDKDFACLKALIFFDPHVIGMGEEGRNSVSGTQYQMQILLEDYTRCEVGKLSSLLMLLPSIFTIRTNLVQTLRKHRKLATMELPRLSKEIVLGETIDELQYSYS